MFEVMFYGGLSLSIISLIVSIVFFIRNHVADLIRDLTVRRGTKIKKQIAVSREIRENQEVHNKDKKEMDSDETVLLMDEETVLLVEEETKLLVEEETELLIEEETRPLTEETDVLYDKVETTEPLVEDMDFGDEEATEILSSESLLGKEGKLGKLENEELPLPDIFDVEEETTVTHTADRIE